MTDTSPLARRPTDRSTLQAAAERANADEAFLAAARWLTATILVEVDDTSHALDVWKGRILSVESGEPLTGWDFAISGSLDQWLGVTGTSGTVPLRITNNQVLAATHWGAVSRLVAVISSDLVSLGATG